MNLLEKIGTDVIKTDLTRKLTIDNVTKAYHVYRINIKNLYYNDQNDRIATWMSEYRSKNPHSPIDSLPKDAYNDIIQNFIIESNPAAINKTKANIGLVGQREAGVVLNDGRIIDGNRRFTCIRKLAEEDPSQCWFEAVILDLDINNNKKGIKILELSIQHGEEQRVDYNNIDKLVGLYHDIVESKLLTEEEYAKSIDVKLPIIKREVEISKLLIEFLEFINMPKQYFVARDYAVYAVLGELQTLISHVKDEQLKTNLKHIVFINTIFEAIIDQKVFIRSIAKMASNNTLERFIKEEVSINDRIKERWDEAKPNDIASLKLFVQHNYDLKNDLVECFKQGKNISATRETHEKPANAVQKGIDAMKQIDINIIDKLNDTEKSQLEEQARTAQSMINIIKKKIQKSNSDENPVEIVIDGPKIIEEEINHAFSIVPSSIDELVTLDSNTNDTLTSLMVKLSVSVGKPGTYKFAFYDEKNNLLSNELTIDLETNVTALRFELLAKASKEKQLFLGISKEGDPKHSFRQLIKFNLKIAFSLDFDF